MAVKSTNSTTSLAPNVAGALCYVPALGLVAAVVLFIVEKNAVVKWNAVQSLIINLIFWIFFITPLLWLLVLPVGIAIFVLQMVLAAKTYQGETVKLPVLSGWTDKVLKKV